jgi:hypothetical protein
MPTTKTQGQERHQEIRVEDRRLSAWDWSADLDDGRLDEINTLKGTVSDLCREIERLEGELERGKVRERELREGLSELAAAGVFDRKRVSQSLRARSLI